MDYTFYWIMSFGSYYKYTGDSDFIVQMYDRIATATDFCISRLNEDGLAEGKPDDWIFIDWADMEKDGCLCAEQMLFSKALEVASLCAMLANKPDDADRYLKRKKELDEKIKKIYWNESKGGFVTTYSKNKKSEQIRRHANIFAILLGFADDEMTESIEKNVLLNDEIPQLTTPYFKFYEMEALCKIGRFDLVTPIISSYWGGMLDNGATSFWEEYKPDLKGDAHYAMYGMPYDKSLCHAWGASPLYLLGRYYLGVEPAEDGCKSFVARPSLGGFEYIDGVVPTSHGGVHLYMDEGKVEIMSEGCDGVLEVFGRKYGIPKGKKLTITK